MATLRKKENCEDYTRSNTAQKPSVPRSQEDYISQVSRKFEGRVTNKSQKFSRTENCLLGALSRLDDFLMNPFVQDHAGTAAETSQNTYSTNQRTNEDNCQSDPHPEANIFRNPMPQNSGTGDGHDNSTKLPKTKTKKKL